MNLLHTDDKNVVLPGSNKSELIGFTEDLFPGSYLYVDKDEKLITLSCIYSKYEGQGNFLNLLDHLKLTKFNLIAHHTSNRMTKILLDYGFVGNSIKLFYNNYYQSIDLIEKVVCSAIWVKTGKREKYCYYITPGATSHEDSSGFVFTGLSHADAMCLMHEHDLKSHFPLNFKNSVQGFITNRRRFVDRELAWKIACRSGQIDKDKIKITGSLFSENLY